MKKTAIALAALGALVAIPAHAKMADVVVTWSLNAPSLECFRTFKSYHHKKTGWIYTNATILCTSGQAIIRYDSRIHVSKMA